MSEQIQRREIDFRDIHPGQIPRVVLAAFDAGEFSDSPVVLLPDRYRIIVGAQSREDFYRQAAEVSAYVGMARLVSGR